MSKRIIALCVLVVCLLSYTGCSGVLSGDESAQSVPLQKIWLIGDKEEFVCAMSNYILEKCDWGENLSALSHEEQVFFTTQLLEMEVNNGGFWQYLYNTDEEIFINTVSAFKEIGADKTAEICQNAFSAFEIHLPEDRAERIDFLEIFGMENCYEVLSEYDDAFCAYEEDLCALNYSYVQAHKDAFD